MTECSLFGLLPAIVRCRNEKLKLLNIISHPGMITSDNDLTQLGLQFKKLN